MGPEPAGGRKLSRREFWQLKEAQAIRDRYADGQPLAGKDHDLVYSLLRQHPRARDKIGCGVAAITADRYIGGSRCFFVVRQDGSAEDFSVSRCLGQDKPRSDRVQAMMSLFDYGTVIRHYLRARHGTAVAAWQGNRG